METWGSLYSQGCPEFVPGGPHHSLASRAPCSWTRSPGVPFACPPHHADATVPASGVPAPSVSCLFALSLPSSLLYSLIHQGFVSDRSGPGPDLGAGDTIAGKTEFLHTWDVGLEETDRDTGHHRGVTPAVKGRGRHRTLHFLKFRPPFMASSRATHTIKPLPYPSHRCLVPSRHPEHLVYLSINI